MRHRFALATLLIVSCSTAQEVTAEFGKPVLLQFGATASFALGLQIEFSAVEEDSRCPTSVQCIQAGRAAVVLRLSPAGQQRSIMLDTVNRREGESLGYHIRLEEVSPYPATTEPIPADSYRIRIVVTRA